MAKRSLLAVSPLAVGYGLNHAMLNLPIPILVIAILGLCLLFLWGYFSYRIASRDKNPFLQACWVCAFGFLMLLLVLYQELVLGRYWFNLFGTAPQLYFLPLFAVATTALLHVRSQLRGLPEKGQGLSPSARRSGPMQNRQKQDPPHGLSMRRIC